MGISGLLQCLKSITHEVHVKDLEGLTVGIDAYCWLHRGACACSAELCRGESTDKFVRFCMRRLDMLLAHGITPWVVFDGAALPMKRGVSRKRKEAREASRAKAEEAVAAGEHGAAYTHYSKAVCITHAMARMWIRELAARGIRFTVAPYEADAQLAYLSREELVDAIITEDSDCLPFCCRRVVLKLEADGSAQEIRLRDLASNASPSFSGWNYSMFLDMCLLAGCDYLPRIHGLGINTAHALVERRREHRPLLAALRAKGKFSIPDGFEADFERARYTFRHQTVFDPRARAAVPLMPLPPALQGRDDLDFLGAVLPPHIAEGIANSALDPCSRQPYDDPLPQPRAAAAAAEVVVAPLRPLPAAFAWLADDDGEQAPAAPQAAHVCATGGSAAGAALSAGASKAAGDGRERRGGGGSGAQTQRAAGDAAADGGAAAAAAAATVAAAASGAGATAAAAAPAAAATPLVLHRPFSVPRSAAPEQPPAADSSSTHSPRTASRPVQSRFFGSARGVLGNSGSGDPAGAAPSTGGRLAGITAAAGGGGAASGEAAAAGEGAVTAAEADAPVLPWQSGSGGATAQQHRQQGGQGGSQGAAAAGACGGGDSGASSGSGGAGGGGGRDAAQPQQAARSLRLLQSQLFGFGPKVAGTAAGPQRRAGENRRTNASTAAAAAPPVAVPAPPPPRPPPGAPLRQPPQAPCAAIAYGGTRAEKHAAAAAAPAPAAATPHSSAAAKPRGGADASAAAAEQGAVAQAPRCIPLAAQHFTCTTVSDTLVTVQRRRLGRGGGGGSRDSGDAEPSPRGGAESLQWLWEARRSDRTSLERTQLGDESALQPAPQLAELSGSAEQWQQLQQPRTPLQLVDSGGGSYGSNHTCGYGGGGGGSRGGSAADSGGGGDFYSPAPAPPGLHQEAQLHPLPWLSPLTAPASAAGGRAPSPMLQPCSGGGLSLFQTGAPPLVLSPLRARASAAPAAPRPYVEPAPLLSSCMARSSSGAHGFSPALPRPPGPRAGGTALGAPALPLLHTLDDDGGAHASDGGAAGGVLHGRGLKRSRAEQRWDARLGGGDAPWWL